MMRIAKFFFVSLAMLSVTILLILGSTAVVGIMATLANLPDFIGISLTISAFIASVLTVLSPAYSLYWEQHFIYCR